MNWLMDSLLPSAVVIALVVAASMAWRLRFGSDTFESKWPDWQVFKPESYLWEGREVEEVERVIDLWNREGGWIPGAAYKELAEALGVSTDRLIHYEPRVGRFAPIETCPDYPHGFTALVSFFCETCSKVHRPGGKP